MRHLEKHNIVTALTGSSLLTFSTSCLFFNFFFQKLSLRQFTVSKIHMQVCCVYIKFKMCSQLQYMHEDRIHQQISLFSQKGCKGQQFFGTGSRPHGVVTFGGVKVFYANETLFSSDLVASKLLMLTAHSLFVITTRQSKKFGG